MMKRRQVVALFALGPALAGRAAAQAWPVRPLRIIVAAGPGSSLDVIARAVGERLAGRIGQAVVVDNRAQAGGTVAMEGVAKAGDGYTIGIGFNGPLAFAPFLYARLSYDPAKDLAPIVLTSSQPNVLAVNAQLPVRSVAELVAHLRANPGKVSYASVGNASSSHLSMEFFKTLTGTYAVHIPFNGAPPAALATASGETQMLMAVPTAINAHVLSGRLRMIAVTGRQRYAPVAAVPTVAESGVPGLAGFEALAWNGFVGPASMPAAHADRLNAEINAIMTEPDVRRRLTAAGLDVVGGSPRAMRDFIAAEVVKWQPIIRRVGAQLD